MSDDERTAAEHQLIDSYYDRYQTVPLPLEYLRAVRDRAELAPGEGLLAWLDTVREDISTSRSMDAAAVKHVHFRRDAVSRGASDIWDQDTVAVAERSADRMLMAAAAQEDLRMCVLWACDFDGSVWRAVRSIDESGNTICGETLPKMIRAVLRE